MSNDKAPYAGFNSIIRFWKDAFEIYKYENGEWVDVGNVDGHLVPSKSPNEDKILYLIDFKIEKYNVLIKENVSYIISNIQPYPKHLEVNVKWLNKLADIYEINDSKNEVGELIQNRNKIKTIKIAFDGISGNVGTGRFIEGSQSAVAYAFNEVNFDRHKHKLEIDGAMYNITQILDESGIGKFVRLNLERSD